MTHSSNKDLTRERILFCAANLFAEKGFTEASMRELAEAVGIKAASLYHHFPSKNAILEHMLEDYSRCNTYVFEAKNLLRPLRDNATANGVAACFEVSFPQERAEYYLKILCVALQEQFRNPIVRRYMTDGFILSAELNTKTVIDVLKELGVIRQDTDPDYWTKAVSSIFYTFAARMLLSIGDKAPGFTGMDMAKMLKHTFEIMLETHGSAKAGGTGLE